MGNSNFEDQQFRNPEAFVSENDARSNMFVPLTLFFTKTMISSSFVTFFRIEVKWLKLASFYSLKILSCWTQLRTLVCDQILGNIAEFL
jgi:hypothetical protein